MKRVSWVEYDLWSAQQSLAKSGEDEERMVWSVGR